MKFFLLLFAGFLFNNIVFAQNSWTVHQGKKIILNALKEDTTANVVQLKNLNKGSLIITYHEPKRKDWSRTLMAYDTGDNELLRKDAYTITLSPALLKQWAKKTLQVKVYTVPRNLNPAIAIKVRRVHLCTLNFL